MGISCCKAKENILKHIIFIFFSKYRRFGNELSMYQIIHLARFPSITSSINMTEYDRRLLCMFFVDQGLKV